MSSLLTIAKKALRQLGVSEINSLTETGQAAKRCNAAVRDCVRVVLGEHPWSHATVWESLTQLSSAPPFGYLYAYQLPNECIRCFNIREDTDLGALPVDFERVRGNVIYTDASPCYAQYVIYAEEDLAKAAPSFIEVCAWKLAEELAVPLALANLMAPMHNGYLFSLDRARLGDAATQRPREADPNRSCSFLSAREYPHTDEDVI